MQWSWPAFGIGAAAGAVACLLLLTDAAPASSEALPSPPAAVTREPVATEPRPERVHRSPSREPEEAVSESSALVDDTEPEPEETAAFSPDGAPAPTLLRPTVRSGPFTVMGGVTYVNPTQDWDEDAPPVNASTAQSLARGRGSAEALLADGRRVSGADIDAMLRSSDDGERETAIGLLLRSDPPGIARLLKLARDTSVGGSLRSTALLAATEAAPQDPAVAAAVAALVGDRNFDVRRTAVELLPRLGGMGADRAVALLRDGDYAGDLLVPLARTVAASDRALDFLLARPDPDVAFAVLRAIGETQPVDEAARARLIARLPDVLRTLLRTPEILTRAGEAFQTVAAAGHHAFLRSVAVDPSLPTGLRLAAVDAALGAAECADGRASLLASTLSDGRSPVELLRAVVERVPADVVADGGVKAALRALAESHPNEWLREEARAKLQASRHAEEDGALRIVSGIYGKDGHMVNVGPVLASMVVGGRLVVEAGNALAGDPLVGIVKDLSVTYEWKGERRTRTIREYERLTLP